VPTENFGDDQEAALRIGAGSKGAQGIDIRILVDADVECAGG
jgi:hypothetical protein